MSVLPRHQAVMPSFRLFCSFRRAPRCFAVHGAVPPVFIFHDAAARHARSFSTLFQHRAVAAVLLAAHAPFSDTSTPPPPSARRIFATSVPQIASSHAAARVDMPPHHVPLCRPADTCLPDIFISFRSRRCAPRRAPSVCGFCVFRRTPCFADAAAPMPLILPRDSFFITLSLYACRAKHARCTGPRFAHALFRCAAPSRFSSRRMPCRSLRCFS